MVNGKWWMMSKFTSHHFISLLIKIGFKLELEVSYKTEIMVSYSNNFVSY
jgi:hypothetical protein